MTENSGKADDKDISDWFLGVPIYTTMPNN